MTPSVPETFPVPDLDDRSFTDLVLEARERAMRSCPQWTDLSVHDPGMALIEVFAHLTEVMLYRINRLPQQAYLSFLNLIGLTRRPPTAAWVELVFRRGDGSLGDHATAGRAGDGPTIPAGTVVSLSAEAGSPVRFVVTEAVRIGPDAHEAVGIGHHCVLVDGELIGTGTGEPGQRCVVVHAPITSTTERHDLLVGVQREQEALAQRGAAREHDGAMYEIWLSVDSFAGVAPGAKVYLVDPASGVITFAPTSAGSAGAAVPPAGANIRAWYRTGGGRQGNVGAGLLTTIEPAIPGVSVTNPGPARGGRDIEPVDAALARGPAEFFALNRAVTAHDYEQLATAGSGSIARAKAFTRVLVRPFAQPGEVEVVLVPEVVSRERLDLPTLLAHQDDEALRRTAAELTERGPLGTRCVTSWAQYKEVSVTARVVVRPEEDPEAVAVRIDRRLHETIAPLPGRGSIPAWAFGQPLRTSNVYRLLEHAEPGVRYVDDVRFVLSDAPDTDVRAVAADPYQTATWYAGAGPVLFRSENDGAGWEVLARFDGEELRRVVPAPRAVRTGMTARHGTVALTTRLSASTASRVYLSRDLGESWDRVAELGTVINDIAWIEREGAPALLLATDKGLFEQPLLPDAVPQQVVVDSGDPDRALYAVAAFVSPRGSWAVAVATQARLGVYLSVAGGARGSFGNVGPPGDHPVDSRCLTVQYDGSATMLWVGAGEHAAGTPGVLRARMFEADVRWEPVSTGWSGGTCWQIACRRRRVLAATQSAGVLLLDSTASSPRWYAPDVNCGLPLRDRPRFEPVPAVDVAGGDGARAMAGGPRGVYLSELPDLARGRGDAGTGQAVVEGVAPRWTGVAHRESRDAVTIPDTWLPCSGTHHIEVVGGYA